MPDRCALRNLPNIGGRDPSTIRTTRNNKLPLGQKVKLHQVSVTLPGRTAMCATWLGEEVIIEGTCWSIGAQAEKDVFAYLQIKELSEKKEQ